MKYTAIVLSAGKGSRMNSDIQKQYLMLEGRPVITYSLEAFEKSRVDEIILVVGSGEEEYCRKEIIEKYKLQKVKRIVTGGKERYHSVFNGLKAVTDSDYVLIHDGARPFLTNEIIERAMRAVVKNRACVVGMPVKDTIKIADSDNRVAETPERSSVWMVQTPQVFSYELIYHAYESMLKEENNAITDDAMVVETVCHQDVILIEGSYRNIKITTPEDLLVARAFLLEK